LRKEHEGLRLRARREGGGRAGFPFGENHPAGARRFVLAPLSELAPQLVHPKLALSVSELLAGLKDTKKIHLLRA